ncbi:MAG TPA: hypothetical protein VGK89_00460 [Candidatus Eisenbacteria bacterium]|jgi:hypothetical protein
MTARSRCSGLAVLTLLAFPTLATRANAGAQKYLNPQFAALTANHKTIAILPFKVTIDMKHMPKDMTIEMLRKSEEDESLEFQKQLYARFLQRAQDGEYTVGFQDVDQTNAMLAKAGIPLDSLAAHTRDEIAHALGADALVSGSIHQARPTSTGAAIAQTLLIGFSGSTQRVDINMSVHNGSDGALLWSYDHTDKGGLSNSVEAMTKSLLKKVAGNFPYRKS